MSITPHTKVEELPQFLTVEEWRTFMRLGRSSAYELIRRGLVPTIRWGRAIRISREVVVKYVNREGHATSVDETTMASGT
jgi:excisionase family DNA binding protein